MSSISFGQLAERMRQRVVELDERSAKAAVAIADAILVDVAQTTPVDTSQAISNWQVALDNPPQGAVPSHFPGAGGSTEAVSEERSISLGRKVLQEKKEPGAIYISNVLPYISRLNEGYSTQAPAGFVERAVLIGRNVIKNYKFWS